MCLVKIMSTSESGSSNKNGDQDFALLDLTYSLVKHDGAGCPSVGIRDVFRGGQGGRA